MNAKNEIQLRIESIDIIRGITILVMIFVNDIAGVVNTPPWMKHGPAFYDGMTFVDLVFPAFLFIVGMSIPFSLGRRLERGDSLTVIWKHVIGRVIGLIAIGLLMVNGDEISGGTLINPGLWIIVMYLCVILIWNRKNEINKYLSGRMSKIIAAAVLISLLFLYRGQDQTGIFQLRTYWWGILGLIGFAYLSACVFYFLFGKNRLALAGSMVLLYCFYMASEAGWGSSISFITEFIHFGSVFGSHAAVIISGILLGDKIKEQANSKNNTAVLTWAFLFGLFQFVAGYLLNQLANIHPMFIISKILATAPWCLISSAYTVWIWMLVYWLVDMKGIKRWTGLVKTAGANPLFAYILAPLAVESIGLISGIIFGLDLYIWLGGFFYTGLVRAAVIALSMTWLTGYLYNKGIQLKL